LNVEILKRGTPPAERTFRGTCYECKSEVRAKAGEIQVVHEDRDGEFGRGGCPVCGTGMVFYPED
jgi:hypothetical protein